MKTSPRQVILIISSAILAGALSAGGWYWHVKHKEAEAANYVYAAAFAKIGRDHTPAEVLDVKAKWAKWVKHHRKEMAFLRTQVANAWQNAQVNLFDEARTKPLDKAVEETAGVILLATGQEDKDSDARLAKMQAENAKLEAELAKDSAETAAKEAAAEAERRQAEAKADAEREQRMRKLDADLKAIDSGLLRNWNLTNGHSLRGYLRLIKRDSIMVQEENGDQQHEIPRSALEFYDQEAVKQLEARRPAR